MSRFSLVRGLRASDGLLRGSGGGVLARLGAAWSSRRGKAAVAQTLLVNVLILGINLLTGVITARLLGPVGRGEQAAITLWPQALAYALTLGLPSALLYNLKRRPEQSSQLFAAALLLGLGMGTVATVAGMFLIPLWLTEYSTQVVHFAQWSMLAAPVMLFTLTFGFALQARGDFHIFNAVRYLNPLMTLAALIALAATGHFTPFNTALAYILPTIPTFLWVLTRLWRAYRPVWRGLRPAFGGLVSYGTRSYGVDLMGQLSLQMDRLFVIGLLAPAAMGIYVVALSLAQMLNVFQAAAVAVLFPKASELGTEGVIRLTGRTVRATTAVTALAAAGLALFGPLALRLVYGPEFVEAVPTLRILLLVMLLNGASLVMVQAFMALGRPGVVNLFQVASLALTVALLSVLVPRYELQGVGFALLISAGARFAFVVLSFPLLLGTRAPRLWPSTDDIAGVRGAIRRMVGR